MAPPKEEEEVQEFHEMGLDDRLLKALALLSWSKPTLIQEKVIPLALEGKDILARARTGTGKTACFLIPIIQKLLQIKSVAKEQKTRVLILTPSKELCVQAHNNIKLLTSSCSKEIVAVDISNTVPLDIQKPQLMESPDIVLSTPSRLLLHIQCGNINIKDNIEMIVVDEADLLFSFGYQKDMTQLCSHFPSIYQAFLMSATLDDDVKSLKKMVLHNPVIIKLEETSLPDTTKLTQYHIKCEDMDKFTLIYTLLKLNLIQGKSLVFVNTVDRCYKLKLFLGHVGIPSCVLNPELPVNTRCHIVEQFNTGLYDIIIASDKSSLDKQLIGGYTEKKKKAGETSQLDPEYGVARGIDFQHVSNVINFDFPKSAQDYIHRVGRTARGKCEGAALSFVSVKEMEKFEEVRSELNEEYDNVDDIFQPFNFKMDEIDGFKYRAREAYRATTKVAIRRARLSEIKQELLTSEKLKTYFEENPRDGMVIRHDGAKVGLVKMQDQLKNVPSYIVPDTLKNRPRKRKSESGPRGVKKAKKQRTKTQQKHQKKASDALKSFQLHQVTTKKKNKKKQ